MQRNQMIIVAIILLFIVGLVTGLIIRMIMLTPPIDDVSIKINPADAQSTVTFERELITQMTQQPDSIAQMTPYYAEALYNEALRLNSRRECELTAETWQLNVFDEVLQRTIAQDFSDVDVQSSVSVVWNSGECNTFIPVRSMTQITATSPDDLFCPLQEIINTYNIGIDTVDDLPSVKRNIQVQITLDGKTILSNLGLIEDALMNNFSCNALPDALRVSG